MQYIKKVNKIEAIQNGGDILTNVIPFLNERGVPYKYTESFLRGSQMGVITNKDNFEREEYSQLNAGDYLVINKGVISIKSAEDFESKYQEDDSVGRKRIDNEISTDINLDTTRAKRSFDLLGETVDELDKINRKIIEKSLATLNKKQPHVRIEFDDIRDVPKVWVDGERVDSFVNGKWVSRINIDWRDNTKTINHKSFDIRYVKVDDNGANETSLAQNNMA